MRIHEYLSTDCEPTNVRLTNKTSQTNQQTQKCQFMTIKL